MIVFDKISPDLVSSVFDDISDWVEGALGIDRTYSVDDIKNLCAAGIWDLHLIHVNGDLSGFFVSRIVQAPQGKMLYGAWVGGKNVFEWIDESMDKLEERAREFECIAISFVGRKGWRKVANFEHEGFYYYKNL